MGNRSWLYLESPATGTDAKIGVEIAEANNNFPVLWQILLADGKPDEAITYQRVFGDAGTGNLSSSAPAALDRIRQLAAFVARHPLLHTLPQLGLQFEALVQHLADELAGATRAEAAPPPRFSANLDELSWLTSNDKQGEFIETCRRDCNECWQAVQRCIEAGDHPGLDAALNIDRFAEWSPWAWQFGFSGLSHVYFSMQDTPRDVRYADFEENDAYDDDTRDYADCISGKLWRFKAENGHWGVCVDDRRSRRVVVEAEWDAIWDSYAPDRHLQWISRGDRIGLLLADPLDARVVLAPQLDEVWNFEDGVATALVGDHIGLLRADGTWLFAPSVDEIWSFAEGYAMARVGDRIGFIDAQGQWVITPRFDEALDFAPCGLAPARTEAGWGLVRPSGEWALQAAWDSIEWRHDWQAFKGSRADKSGLIDAQGHVGIEPVYAQLDLLEGYGHGAYSDDAERAPVCLIAEREDGQRGLVDTQGRVLVPLDYGRFSAFEPLQREDGQLLSAGSCVRIASKGGRKGKSAPWVYGVYDIAAGRELIPCRHRHLQFLAWGDETGWLVGDPVPRAQQTVPDEMILGIARRDGSVLHRQAYTWIAKAMAISDRWLAMVVRMEILKRWSAGKPVQAERSDGGTYIYAWLHADGREQAHEDYLASCYAEGDLDAAYELACYYRDNRNIETEGEAALQWMARAAGIAAGGDIAAPAQADAQGLPSAMRDLAFMLRDGIACDADQAAARAWLEHAVEHGGADDSRVHANLGYMLFEGLGGETDQQRGLHHYEIAAEANNSMALFNLGIVYKAGEMGLPDPERALGYLRRAEQAGDADATYYVGELLYKIAREMEDKDSEAAVGRFSEASYFLRKAADRDDIGNLACWACYKLGMMYYNGDGWPQDHGESEQWLLRGAGQDGSITGNDGSVSCVEMLAEHVYGDTESPLYDAEKAQAWAGRLL